MLQGEARALFIGIAGALNTNDLALEILGVFNIRARDKCHGSVARKSAEHDDIAILHRNGNHQISRHDRHIDFVGRQCHRRDGTRRVDNLRVDPFLGEEARLLGDERHRVGHGAGGVTDAQLLALPLGAGIVNPARYKNQCKQL